MKVLLNILFLLVTTVTIGQTDLSKINKLYLDCTICDTTYVISNDVFSVDFTGNIYILYAESCDNPILVTPVEEDVKSLLFWIEQYPCDNMKYSQYYYQDLVEEKIWE